MLDARADPLAVTAHLVKPRTRAPHLQVPLLSTPDVVKLWSSRLCPLEPTTGTSERSETGRNEVSGAGLKIFYDFSFFSPAPKANPQWVLVSIGDNVGLYEATQPP